jgi:putative toxin-antitoxin system antitoxin component (TIGR02293 family)
MTNLQFLQVEAGPVGLEENHAYLQLVGIEPRSTVQLIADLREGLTSASFSRFASNIELSEGALSQLISLSTRTLHRRKNGAAQGRLDFRSSEALVRLARVFGSAIELFEGDVGAARAWMKTPRPALSNISPLEMSSTEVGAREVGLLIERLEEGVFS